MKRQRSWLVLAAAGALALGAAAMARDAKVIALVDKGEVFDLADLRDGETRVFGEGDRQLTGVREGDEVRITRDARSDAKVLSIRCNVTSDTCQVVTSDDGDQVAVRIEKTRRCVDGEGDCMTDDIDVIALGGGAAGHSERTIEIVTEGSATADGLHWVAADGSRVRLSCPEGDATMWVEQGEAARTFLCPKHSVPLEKGEAGGSRRIIIERRAE